MDDKKEVQVTILSPPLNDDKATTEEFFSILRAVAPGTNLRTSLDGALKAGKGALIVVENSEVPALLDGGFRINTRFTPQRLIELTKMDGGIILSKDMKKINYANVLLTPDSKIKSNETGTRHKAAERTSKQAGTLVIAISERRHEITLYYKNIRHILVSSDELLRKANENIQILEKQRDLFDKHIEKLTSLELKNYPNIHQASIVIQKGRIIQKIAGELQKNIIELGKEGVILKTRLKELTNDVEREMDLVIKDYTNLDVKKTKALVESLSYDEILDKENILKSLAHEKPGQSTQIQGWRILSKTSFPEKEIASVIKEAGTIGKAINSSTQFYKKILGEDMGNTFKEEVEKIKLNL